MKFLKVNCHYYIALQLKKHICMHPAQEIQQFHLTLLCMLILSSKNKGGNKKIMIESVFQIDRIGYIDIKQLI